MRSTKGECERDMESEIFSKVVVVGFVENKRVDLIGKKDKHRVEIG